MTVGAQEKIPGKFFDYGGDRYNVRHLDFGAVGDGLVDDTAAVQAALDLAETNGGGTVYFPPGTYLISADLDVDRHVNMMGAGPANTQILATVTDRFVTPTGSDNWTHLIEGIYFNKVGIQYGSTIAHFANGVTIRHCEVANVAVGIEYQFNTWQTLIQDCRIYSCDVGVKYKYSTVTINAGPHTKIVSSGIFGNVVGVLLDGDTADGVSLHITDCDIENNTGNAIVASGGTGQETQIFCNNLHLELNTGGAWIDVDSACTVFLDNLWAFPSGSYTSLFKISGAARIYLRSGRVQWETAKLVELQGGVLSLSQDFQFGAGKFFGLGSGEMVTPSSTDGQIINGAPGHGIYPNDVGGKVFAAQREITAQAASSAPNQEMTIIQAYDASTRVWDFVLETTALNGGGGNNILRIFLNPGGTVVINLTLPLFVGLGIFKLTYRPDIAGGATGRLKLSGHYTITATGATTTYFISAVEPADFWKLKRFLEIATLNSPDHADITVTQWYEYVL